MAQIVEPPGVHSNGLPPHSAMSMPRCSAYQSRRLAAPAARWNTPPIPVTRSMRPMLRDLAAGEGGARRRRVRLRQVALDELDDLLDQRAQLTAHLPGQRLEEGVHARRQVGRGEL